MEWNGMDGMEWNGWNGPDGMDLMDSGWTEWTEDGTRNEGWNGMEWKEWMEWNGMEWNGMESMESWMDRCGEYVWFRRHCLSSTWRGSPEDCRAERNGGR